MTNFLVDTNHASRLMERNERILQRIRQAEAGGDSFGVSMTIVAELYYAVFASQKREQNLKRLSKLLETLHVFAFDQVAAEEFGRIQAEQKRKGRPIPPLDAQIAAVARIHNLTVLTADRHFGLVDNIEADNWLND